MRERDARLKDLHGPDLPGRVATSPHILPANRLGRRIDLTAARDVVAHAPCVLFWSLAGALRMPAGLSNQALRFPVS
jgi:hypothetical protein